MVMNNTSVAKTEERVTVIGRIEERAGSASNRNRFSGLSSDDSNFMNNLASSPWLVKQAEQECQRVLAEISALQSEKRWDDINALFYPVEEKLPDIYAAGMDSIIRQEVSFSLGRAGRHQDAIKCISPVVKKEPDNVMAHYSLAYTVLDLLYNARARKHVVTPARKQEMIALAHRHFAIAQELRPDSVTFFYREGILYKEIEDKPAKAVPLFQKAVANWDRLSEQEKKSHHQQRPKFIRSLYHMASALLKTGMTAKSLDTLERMMKEDRNRDHVSPVFKHFAMGKVLYALGRPSEALDHLDTADFRKENNQPVEYVHELAARCALTLGNVDKALAYITKVPKQRRRPYVQWTHADALAAKGQQGDALKLLAACAERDRRTGHIAMIRAARIHYAEGRMEDALKQASEASDFCEKNFGNASKEALFWQAAALHGLSKNIEALELLEDLSARRFQYPGFSRLLSMVRKAARKEETRNLSRQNTVISLIK